MPRCFRKNCPIRLHKSRSIGNYSAAAELRIIRSKQNPRTRNSELSSCNAQITDYSRRGRVDEARKLFDEIRIRDVVTWTAMVSCYVTNGRLQEARQLFDEMPERNVVSWTAMMSGYVKYGRIEEAHILFDHMPHRNIVAWNTLIMGYLQKGMLENARQLFDRMPEKNAATWNAMISAYAQKGQLDVACWYFEEMPDKNVISWTSMVAAYTQNGKVVDARRLFDEMPEKNVVSWNAMISGYAKNSKLDEARALFDEMPERNVDSWNNMLTGYVWNDRIEDARKLFDAMPERNVVTWTGMITGYVQSEQGEEALGLFLDMFRDCVRPNQVTLVSVLGACGSLAVLDQGMQVQALGVKIGLDGETFVKNALLSMYAKCGCVDEARRIFAENPTKDVVFWNSMIAGYAQHGCACEALRLFQDMQSSGMRPSDVTFINLLYACSHAGLVDEGLKFFDAMQNVYSLSPRAEHYTCVIDLLGRAGRLDEAKNVIFNAKCPQSAGMWGALLGACRTHGDRELGQYAAERLFELQPLEAATYMHLSNIYKADKRFDEAKRIRMLMKNKGLKKQPGCSWMDVKRRTHVFLAGDKSHPQSEKIYATLDLLDRQMKQLGYAPNTVGVLVNLEEELKERMLGHHSEKLAIAFGIVSLPQVMPLRIFKNLRMCCDCHTAIKFISKIVGRRISVRDDSRWHHFERGLCSCNDYW